MAKKIYDPLHGFIHLSAIEKKIIDTFAFQRLHTLHQLGVAYLVYPGASHTRFEHSLGVMHVATQIFDKITETWSAEHDLPYWRQIVRLAALCHDMGHLPFSHVAEKKILGSGGHEVWTKKLIESSYLHPIWEDVQKQFPTENPIQDVLCVSLGKDKFNFNFSPWQELMSQIITGDFFGADRIDYLLRDARCTGVAYGLFDDHQLIETLKIVPFNGKFQLGIEESGVASCEALMIARHFMHRRVYQYGSVKAYSFHMARFMEQFYHKHQPLESLDKYISFTDSEVLSELRKCFSEGHEDALALFTRKHRYIALELPKFFTKEDLLEWQSRFQIESLEMEIHDVKPQKFDFPVELRGGKVVQADSCSDLKLPPSGASWVYIHPKYNELMDSFPLGACLN